MNPSVLVVEDDPTLNRLLVKELRKAGYELDSASSWQAARERIVRSKLSAGDRATSTATSSKRTRRLSEPTTLPDACRSAQVAEPSLKACSWRAWRMSSTCHCVELVF